MTTVEEAEQIILARLQDYGTETLPFEQALGRVLAADIKADRDLPPFNRVTMDGIAITYQAIQQGVTSYHIKATQAAGEEPVNIGATGECIEIMTGAALSATLDTIIRYEDLDINNGVAKLLVADVKQGQNIHSKGKDKKQGDTVAAKDQLVTPAIISLAASVGEAALPVKKHPRVMIISSGDELVDVTDEPSGYQIRRSNNYTIKAVLTGHGLPADMLHIPDDPAVTKKQIGHCLQNYDVILLSGGISMGKFDYIPQALEDLEVKKLFHKVQQRPGKPFWFGRHQNGVLVFAFPGNPVATFMCLHRYFLPWLNATLGLPPQPPVYAQLAGNFTFTPQLQYFLQVKLTFTDQGVLSARPVEGNGSGDFANLADTDAFMELPLAKNEFKQGEVFKVHLFKPV
ncbi:molybdopterin molybdotransferase MoeA [Mucilaginibacter phyllosphaerae]|uniref:Molybdopterin molybdenumtransferase n=1 Tax=Mucilaginibacter phyllosphaerae TaxID=1812349 RepID=A0A4Y8AIB2_9SPHI|nr:molybdopterin molybdotransferase MoeA [Mucilaginibacter phyllosphaerae]MBB3968174.1 molybdopterin molybdotransferase [Mucilaginibacter phyllosphaerae]TEW68813.1 molybdopterin molybdotransferase MoeA [Mucilaginibacter phyllosphaerae]GGH00741.1 molybdopterin molybdenumtransferase MoeA [Mucilaginibacter phyllosphaerae]